MGFISEGNNSPSQSNPLHIVRHTIQDALHLLVTPDTTAAPLRVLNQRAQRRELHPTSGHGAPINVCRVSRAAQMPVQPSQRTEFIPAQEALIARSIPGARRRLVLLVRWHPARAGRVCEEAVGVRDEAVLAVGPHNKFVHLLACDTGTACPRFCMHDERGDADELLVAPASNAAECPRFVRG